MEISYTPQHGDYMLVHHQEILNFKETHITLATVTEPPKIDADVPAEYRGAADAALPGALNSVNK